MSIPSAVPFVTAEPCPVSKKRLEAARQIENAVNVESHHSDERLAGPGQALEPDIDTRSRLRLALLDDVGEDAEAGGEVQPPHDLFEQCSRRTMVSDFIRGRVESDDHVAAAMRQDRRKSNRILFLIVAGAVRLNPGSEMTAAPTSCGARTAVAHMSRQLASGRLPSPLATAAMTSLVSASSWWRPMTVPPEESSPALQPSDRQRVEIRISMVRVASRVRKLASVTPSSTKSRV